MKTYPTAIYLAGPIDGISIEEGCSWREELAKSVPSGVLLVSPAHAYLGTVNTANAKQMDYLNRNLIQNCQGFLANLLGPGRGFGTVREIEFAVLSNRFVAVAGHDSLHESMMTYDFPIVDTLMEGVESIIDRVATKRNEPPMGLPAFLFPQQRDEDGDDRED